MLRQGMRRRLVLLVLGFLGLGLCFGFGFLGLLFTLLFRLFRFRLGLCLGLLLTDLGTCGLGGSPCLGG